MNFIKDLRQWGGLHLLLCAAIYFLTGLVGGPALFLNLSVELRAQILLSLFFVGCLARRSKGVVVVGHEETPCNWQGVANIKARPISALA